MFIPSENSKAYVTSGTTRNSFNSRFTTIEHTVNPSQPRLVNKPESQNVVFISKFNQEDDISRFPRNQPRSFTPSSDTNPRSTPPSPQRVFKLTRGIPTREKQTEKPRINFSNNFYYHYYDKEADVQGLSCFTCLVKKSQESDGCLKSCSNFLSCPVYCWCFFIIPIVFLLLLTIILLLLKGAGQI